MVTAIFPRPESAVRVIYPPLTTESPTPVTLPRPPRRSAPRARQSLSPIVSGKGADQNAHRGCVRRPSVAKVRPDRGEGSANSHAWRTHSRTRARHVDAQRVPEVPGHCVSLLQVQICCLLPGKSLFPGGRGRGWGGRGRGGRGRGGRRDEGRSGDGVAFTAGEGARRCARRCIGLGLGRVRVRVRVRFRVRLRVWVRGRGRGRGRV